MKYQNDNRSNTCLEEMFSHRARGVPQDTYYEQERNFDAGFTPTETPARYMGTTRVEGKLYKVFQL